ncbi:hypothetical protein BS47DRAFT_1390437 [Hydnum rufescens UP504]|uniref:Uncharacterized protein n=1 Tax=Hydnum rufescens UP504 TaxID=1448309 RepID=A0A9P6B382_9AGAM|nr:hypothetical protein BS47DRAFT_1390437 [Hydnum rufescens UP504]
MTIGPTCRMAAPSTASSCFPWSAAAIAPSADFGMQIGTSLFTIFVIQLHDEIKVGTQGFHVKLSNPSDIVVRLARGDVNMPNFDSFPIHVQVPEAKFEAAVYKLLHSEPNILASHLLLSPYSSAACRCLFLFERREGKNNVWNDLSPAEQTCVLVQAARIRASLFNFNLPLDFAAVWLRERLFEQRPKSPPISVAPTGEFCIALFASKIEATIGNIGDIIGREGHNNTVGPIAAAAKQSPLRLIPYIIPTDSDQCSLSSRSRARRFRRS